MGFTARDWPLMCCICFEGLTSETCAVDSNGVKWDVCKGDCAASTGVEETSPQDS